MKFNRFAKFIVILSFLFLGNISYADNVQDALNKYEEGVEYYAQGQYEQAVSSFKRATELNPDYIDAYFNLGSLLEYLNKEREALEAFKQIVLRKPNDYEAVYKAAELSKKLGDLDKARMYVSLIPQDSDFGLQAKELAQSIKISSPAQTKVSQPASVSSSSASSSTASSSSSAVSSSKEDIPRSTYQTYQKESPISHSNGSYDNIPSPTGIAADSLGNLYVA
ncbi:tetratricopeptide repeat protein, partial [bacterium]|nr:tetratricopeptide repeat protein [bacterium]